MSEFILVAYTEQEAEVCRQYSNMQELVRCKDCKYGEKTPTFRYYPNITWCNQHSTSHNDDWFCANGVKKE